MTMAMVSALRFPSLGITSLSLLNWPIHLTAIGLWYTVVLIVATLVVDTCRGVLYEQRTHPTRSLACPPNYSVWPSLAHLRLLSSSTPRPLPKTLGLPPASLCSTRPLWCS